MGRFSRWGRQHFVILGVEQAEDRCVVYASKALAGVQLSMQQDYTTVTWELDPFARTIPCGPPRIDLNVTMYEVTMVVGVDFADCFRKLFDAWSPDSDDVEQTPIASQPALEAERRALGPGGTS